MAQKCRHLAQLGFDRLRGQLGRAGAGTERPSAGLVGRKVGGGNGASRQAGEERPGPFEHLVGVGAAHERRDRRCLLLLAAAPAELPEAAVKPPAVARVGQEGARKETGAEWDEGGDA